MICQDFKLGSCQTQLGMEGRGGMVFLHRGAEHCKHGPKKYQRSASNFTLSALELISDISPKLSWQSSVITPRTHVCTRSQRHGATLFAKVCTSQFLECHATPHIETPIFPLKTRATCLQAWSPEQLLSRSLASRIGTKFLHNNVIV